MGLPVRTELALTGFLGGTWNFPITNEFTCANGTSTNNFKNRFTKIDGITSRYNTRQCGEIFYIQIDICGAYFIFIAIWNSGASDSGTKRFQSRFSKFKITFFG